MRQQYPFSGSRQSQELAPRGHRYEEFAFFGTVWLNAGRFEDFVVLI